MREVRPIDANALLECLRIAKKHFEDKGDMLLMFRVDQMLSVLETDGVMPTLDYEPVRHGRWIKSKTEKLYFSYGMEGYYDYPELCSVCHYDATENGCGVGNYCPNCGAKMNGGKES